MRCPEWRWQVDDVPVRLQPRPKRQPERTGTTVSSSSFIYNKYNVIVINVIHIENSIKSNIPYDKLKQKITTYQNRTTHFDKWLDGWKTVVSVGWSTIVEWCRSGVSHWLFILWKTVADAVEQGNLTEGKKRGNNHSRQSCNVIVNNKRCVCSVHVSYLVCTYRMIDILNMSILLTREPKVIGRWPFKLFNKNRDLLGQFLPLTVKFHANSLKVMLIL